MGIADFKSHMQRYGWYLFKDFVPTNLVNRMIIDLEDSYKECRKIQIKNGVGNSDGTTHHLIGQGDSFLEYLELFEKLDEYAESYFGGKYILNSFGGNILNSGSSYAGEVHRDIRSFSGDLPLMLNTIVMLDEFSDENGATLLMNKGHHYGDKPLEGIFNKHSFKIRGGAGSVVLFNSNLWHRAGINITDKPRRSVTPMFTRPFYKPQFDYTQFIKPDHSIWIKQLLGHYSRIPKTLDEWYQKPEKRFYRKNQG